MPNSAPERRFFLLALIAVLLVSAVFLFAVSLDADAQERKFNLMFAPLPGVEASYSIQSRLSTSGKDFLGKTISLEAEVFGDTDFTIMNSAAGETRTRISIPGIKMFARLPASQTTGLIRTKPGQVLEVTFNTAGKIMSIRNQEALEQDFESNISFFQMIDDYFPVFPVVPVKPGDTWTDERTLRLPFQGLNLTVKLRTDYKLENVIKTADGEKALVSTLYRAEVSGVQMVQDAEAVFSGQGSGTGSLQFLLNQKVFSEYQAAFSVNASFSMQRRNEKILDFPFTFSVFAYINLNRLGKR